MGKVSWETRRHLHKHDLPSRRSRYMFIENKKKSNPILTYLNWVCNHHYSFFLPRINAQNDVKTIISEKKN